MTTTLESLLNGTNATFIAEMYARYLENPRSVDVSWQEVFTGFDDDADTLMADQQGASWAPSETGVIGQHADNGGSPSEVLESNAGLAPPPATLARGLAGRPSAEAVREATRDSLAALMMIRVYRVRGHLIATFDPLNLEGTVYHPELDPKTFGFTETDMDRPIFINNVLGLETATAREILQVLKDTYCSNIGVEYMHMQEPDERNWIQYRIEGAHNRTQFTLKGKRAIYERLVEAEGFEQFLDKKYKGTKRFGLDGGESMIAALEQILKRSSQLGVKECVIGMPHRGRLNVLASIMAKPYVAMFSEFEGVSAQPEYVQGSGDVKYHLGTSSDRVFDSNQIHLSLTANPSHLEAVNTVVQGKVRAKQDQRGDKARRQVFGLLMHGDAAFSGQGLVFESLDMSQLAGYQTGGTVHFIVNNQIGFTTNPSKHRSGPYCSDLAKAVQAPIFHVNGDDPEAVVHIARIAAEFRHEFGKDVVIDMFCYRRHGHNEGDEPMFTQPLMYKAIAKHPTTRTLYAQKLAAENVLSEAEAKQMDADFDARLEKDFEAAKNYKPNKADWFEGEWKGLVHLTGEEELQEYETSVPMELLREVGTALSEPPANFNLNSKIARQLKAKRKMIESGEGVDWSTAEALAYGTLLAEGYGVRLSGQDSGRGTFSHRHCVLTDQENENKFIPLNNIRRDQGYFEVLDSPLSEAGVLGFEYGYTLADPNKLVLWEAQFGDFANGAQVIIDQFVSSGESKWLRLSGVVMLLPHGFEGQGPEHSSARLERYLQSSAEDNWQVVNCTTPSNFFHILRRQMKRNFRKPLIVMTPKSLLRHKLVVSNLGEMGPDTHFRRVIPEVDRIAIDKNVKRLVLCSGKVYYDLLQARREEKIKDVAIVRVEQFYPWPRQTLRQQLARYPKAEVIWCQEEPANMGGWMFVQPRLTHLVEEMQGPTAKPLFVGRKASASPATGSAKKHIAEQTTLVREALSVPVKDLQQPFLRAFKFTGGSHHKDED